MASAGTHTFSGKSWKVKPVHCISVDPRMPQSGKVMIDTTHLSNTRFARTRSDFPCLSLDGPKNQDIWPELELFVPLTLTCE